MIQIVGINPGNAAASADLAAGAPGINRLRLAQDSEKAASGNADTAFSGRGIGGGAADALPRANRVFERLGILLANEFEREAFLEISDQP